MHHVKGASPRTVSGMAYALPLRMLKFSAGFLSVIGSYIRGLHANRDHLVSMLCSTIKLTDLAD